MKIKALVIDLDGCLYPSSQEHRADILCFKRIDRYLKINGLMDKLPKDIEQIKKPYLSKGLTSEFIEYLSKTMKIDEVPLSKYSYNINPRHAGVKKNPQLSKLFYELSKYYDMWIFSNSPAIWVNRTIAIIGVARYIKRGQVINMDNMGRHIKPSPHAFRFMLKKVGVGKRELLFIDDKKRNIAGAKKVGINSRVSKWGSGNKINSTYYILTEMLNQKKVKKL